MNGHLVQGADERLVDGGPPNQRNRFERPHLAPPRRRDERMEQGGPHRRLAAPHHHDTAGGLKRPAQRLNDPPVHPQRRQIRRARPERIERHRRRRAHHGREEGHHEVRLDGPHRHGRRRGADRTLPEPGQVAQAADDGPVQFVRRVGAVRQHALQAIPHPAVSFARRDEVHGRGSLAERLDEVKLQILRLGGARGPGRLRVPP